MHTIDLTTHGVTGTVTLRPTSSDHVYLTTEGAHVNDDTPAVTYRGRRFLVGADAYVDDSGTFTVTMRPYGMTSAPVSNLSKSRMATDSERAHIALALLDALDAAPKDVMARMLWHAENVRLHRLQETAIHDRAKAETALLAAQAEVTHLASLIRTHSARKV
jgi:hypothetical protein